MNLNVYYTCVKFLKSVSLQVLELEAPNGSKREFCC
ncbi:hypothetical protein BVRB_7g167670 [Beta vulgaris subsp. vulgaris]|nr:hypothetical protein BVRB_7g167670 [Beta vulgaris subsp. vulgaris]